MAKLNELGEGRNMHSLGMLQDLAFSLITYDFQARDEQSERKYRFYILF